MFVPPAASSAASEPNRRDARTRAVVPAHPQPGVLEWFRLGQREQVELTLSSLQLVGVRHLRTGISWADWHTTEGPAWYDWLVPRLAAAGLEVLPCLLYTPPALGLQPKTSSPPADPKAYADFLDVIIQRYGQHFSHVELWNELNNRSEYDFSLDPGWHRCSEMLGNAAYWARHCGKQVVLGGMSPLDPAWLDLMLGRGLAPYVDVVGLHGFPDVFDPHFEPWADQVRRIQQVLQTHQMAARIWITEVGFSTWQHDERKQMRVFADLLQAPVERFFWYGMHDLDATHPTVDGYHLDEREYHFGLRTSLANGNQPKLLFRAWSGQGILGIQQLLDWTEGLEQPNPNQLLPAAGESSVVAATNGSSNGNGHRHRQSPEGYTLVTGGAGFIGTNLVNRLLEQGESVLVLDNLSRPGVERNLAWLKARHHDGLRVHLADLRNPHAVRLAAQHAQMVYHLGAQVAVTTSLDNPAQDFAINLQGTHHLLEALRRRLTPPPVVFTSTNKVYGDLDGLALAAHPDGYRPIDAAIQAYGISEQQPLSFHSPYGCSKGAADQYVLDAARTLGIPGTVFRMSCIYGYHQHGNVDQGWVAHFLIRALQNQPVTLYGDGLQVRDLLFADDLVDAFLLAGQHMPQLSGQAVNIGGGPTNAVSIRQVIDAIQTLHGPYTGLLADRWRPGDQRYYVSDTRRFQALTGWQPRTDWRSGLARLYHWLRPAYGTAQLPRIPALFHEAAPGTTPSALAS